MGRKNKQINKCILNSNKWQWTNEKVSNSNKWHEAIQRNDEIVRASLGDNIKLSGPSTILRTWFLSWVLSGQEEPVSLVNICRTIILPMRNSWYKVLETIVASKVTPISQILILLLFDHGHWRCDISQVRLYKKIIIAPWEVYEWQPWLCKIIYLLTFNNL